jgi:putative oxidoreductase
MNTLKNLSRYEDAGKLALRLILASIFLGHAQLKFGTWGMQPTEQFPAAMLSIARALSILEPLAALSLVLGLLTPATNLSIGAFMLAVIYMKINIWHSGFIGEQGTGWELDLAVLGGALALLLGGSGKYSLENRKAQSNV